MPVDGEVVERLAPPRISTDVGGGFIDAMIRPGKGEPRVRQCLDDTPALDQGTVAGAASTTGRLDSTSEDIPRRCSLSRNRATVSTDIPKRRHAHTRVIMTAGFEESFSIPRGYPRSVGRRQNSLLVSPDPEPIVPVAPPTLAGGGIETARECAGDRSGWGAVVRARADANPWPGLRRRGRSSVQSVSRLCRWLFHNIKQRPDDPVLAPDERTET
jgi:hypothetical protein